MVLASCSGKVPKLIYESKIKADEIIVDKSDRKVVLLRGKKILKEYDMRMGFTPEGHKRFEGDGKTPEGKYFISHKNPNSKFFLSLLVSYPNANDVAYAKEQGKKPGNAIMIHGQPNDIKWMERFKNQYRDWTAGCIAVSDKDMVEIYSMVDVGTHITIRR